MVLCGSFSFVRSACGVVHCFCVYLFSHILMFPGAGPKRRRRGSFTGGWREREREAFAAASKVLPLPFLPTSHATRQFPPSSSSAIRDGASWGEIAREERETAKTVRRGRRRLQ